jgi:hypothetical protein
MKPLALAWRECTSYKDAQDVKQCVYAFRVGDDILYVGKARKFGGPSGRYAFGYRYLIDALLAAGHKLYVAPLADEQWDSVIDIEQTLIKAWDPITDQKRRDTIAITVDCTLPWKIL